MFYGQHPFTHIIWLWTAEVYVTLTWCQTAFIPKESLFTLSEMLRLNLLRSWPGLEWAGLNYSIHSSILSIRHVSNSLIWVCLKEYHRFNTSSIDSKCVVYHIKKKTFWHIPDFILSFKNMRVLSKYESTVRHWFSHIGLSAIFVFWTLSCHGDKVVKF